MNFVFNNFLNVIKIKKLQKIPEKKIKILNFQTKFNSNNQILIPLSSFLYQHFDQMDRT